MLLVVLSGELLGDPQEPDGAQREAGRPKRAMISPDSPRANASGLTMTKVR